MARNCNINIAQYLSMSKNNPTIKLGKFIEYNMRNIFLEKSYRKCGGGNITGPFSKNSKLAYLCFKSPKFYIQFFFIVCQVEGYQNILKLCCRPLAFTSYKALLKN